MNVRETIDSSTKKLAKIRRLSFVMKFSLGNPTAVGSATARFAFCHCRLIHPNLHFGHAAAKQFVTAVLMPICYAIP
jgi:hypothetical protein